MSAQLNMQGKHTVAVGHVIVAAVAAVMMHSGSCSEGDGAILGDAR